MKITRENDECLKVIMPVDDFTIIWISDLHFDSKYSIWKQVKKYLLDNPKSYIIFGGDSLDVMQFVKDFRGTKGDDKYGTTDYANRVIKEVRKEILPFKDRIISWNRGNHDNSIIKHHNLDLLDLICGDEVNIHEYTGYILIQNTKGRNNLTHFSHSPEAGGKRSKGALAVDLAKAQFPSADLWLREHIHDGFILPVRQETFSNKDCSVVYKNKWHVQNICAKDENKGKRNGFHHERNMGTRPTGVCRIKFKTNKHTKALDIHRINHILL